MPERLKEPHFCGVGQAILIRAAHLVHIEFEAMRLPVPLPCFAVDAFRSVADLSKCRYKRARRRTDEEDGQHSHVVVVQGERDFVDVATKLGRKQQ
ncbi:hypothetical protein DOTSEDRAFT_69270 [Dothistroma septosporum NZE10]|uniref:Uncharacterized protein n=1 Tax=Dothistroma septosporum (strain NZE10 / CBS 128990) TaxID=675120 RepID=N1PV67_DOTSN|nr:hypothetical protein DOTSEDRAFT_69270 [Dothistroma septosporum NZE10]